METANIKELKHISAEMRSILERSARENRGTNPQERELLIQLEASREALLDDMVFTGYV